MNRILINNLLQQIENILYEKSWLDESFRHKLMEGMLHHDLYHLGQISITLKFLQ